MLHNLAAALNMLGDVEEIAAAITAELRTIIDYHNCRVYLLQPDGDTLFPVAFRGELFTDYATESLPALVSRLGFAQFDEDDRRLLEVLASHAAVAFQTARLLEAERREARVSGALLRLSQAMTSEHTVGEIFQRAIE